MRIYLHVFIICCLLKIFENDAIDVLKNHCTHNKALHPPNIPEEHPSQFEGVNNRNESGDESGD